MSVRRRKREIATRQVKRFNDSLVSEYDFRPFYLVLMHALLLWMVVVLFLNKYQQHFSEKGTSKKEFTGQK